MAKNKKTYSSKIEKDNLSKFSKKLFKEDLLFMLGGLFIVFAVYSFSLFRPWLPYDERLYFSESLFPIPIFFNEISEIINNFVVNYHLESNNTFFSNHTNLRSDFLSGALAVFISFFLKKNAFWYHLFQLFIHILNTFLVWVIFSRVHNLFLENKIGKTFFVLTFTLLWALHPGSTEAVLLTTNWVATLTYSFCFLFVIFELNNFNEANKVFKTIFISISFYFLMCFSEHPYSFPIIIFFLLFSISLKLTRSLKKSLFISFNKSFPYFLGLLVFVLLSLLNPESAISNLNLQKNIFSTSLYVFFERNFFLVPQIFLHLFNILLFPKTLSIYQSTLTKISSSYNLYYIFSLLAYLWLIFSPIILFLIYRKSKAVFIFPLFYVFFFALFPFLHILTPTYCLSADRYVYFPSFFLFLIIFLLTCIRLNENNFKAIKVSCIIILSLISIRTLVRIQEWNNSEKLYLSSIHSEKNHLYKGQRLSILANHYGQENKKEKMLKTLEESLIELEKAMKGYKTYNEEDNSSTLKNYGLDKKSLLRKTAYAIATIKNDNLQDPPEKTLAYIEPYFKNNFSKLTINEINLYAEILIKANKKNEGKELLEKGLKRFPYSSNLLFQIYDLYTDLKESPDKRFLILEKLRKYFPNDKLTLHKLFDFYTEKKDIPNQAWYAYLIGLREHSIEYYQKSVSFYLDINDLKSAYFILKKLAKLSPNNPLTYLLSARYLEQRGSKNQILGVLITAYKLCNLEENKNNLQLTKSVLVSLIKVNQNLGNTKEAEKYLKEFESIGKLSDEDKKHILLIEKR